ncbi:MAG TPA: alpha/beta fold hydrolase [Thermoleophilaceae bacterium]|jgi:2-succinyl-6-hydroxy-2,4-cyclohexadiene-1-carboxylate synthase
MEAPAVIFVPGFMQRGDAWSPVGELVAERYPSAYLDFRTHSFEARLGELREAARPGSAVVGYSMGGRLALHLAVREPERLAALVTVGASPGIDDPEERRRRAADDERLAAWMEYSSIDEVVDRWEKLPVFAGQSAELVEAQRPGRLDHDPRLLATLLRSAGQGALPGIWDELRRLPTPVLALAGEHDERYVAAARRIALLAPRGDALPVMGAGHAAHLERPEAVAGLVLEFLDQHLGQGGVVD